VSSLSLIVLYFFSEQGGEVVVDRMLMYGI
jgi:hypothetical protein